MIPLLGLAHADCERVGHGLVAQPANTLSSLAFAVAGAWILLQATRAWRRRTELVVFGIAASTNAAGGILYHGLQWPGSRWVHDTAIMSVLVFIAAFVLGELRGRDTRWTLRVYAASLVAVGAWLALVPASTDVLSAALAVGIGVWELAEYRRELPLIRIEGLNARRLARAGVLVALALGATAFLIGRSGAPFCTPASAFQWHAVWHVLSAAAMALYAYGAIEPHPRSPHRSRV